MPDYKLKSGDIVFVASADVDSFLKNNEGATLVETKVEVPKKTKDPVVVDQAAESKEVTGSNLENGSLEPLSNEQASFNYEQRTGEKPKSIMYLTDEDYKATNVVSDFMPVDNNEVFSRNRNRIDELQKDRGELESKATLYSYNNMPGLESVAYVKDQLKAFDEASTAEIELMENNPEFKLRNDAITQLSKNTGNNQATGDPVDDLASEFNILNLFKGKSYYKNQEASEIVSLNKDVENAVVAKLDNKQLQKLAGGFYTLEEKENLIKEVKTPIIKKKIKEVKNLNIESRRKAEIEIGIINTSQEAIKKSIGDLTNGNMSFGKDSSPTEEQINEYNSLVETFNEIKKQGESVVSNYNKEASANESVLKSFEGDYGVDLAVGIINNKFKLSDDAQKFREKYAGDGFWNASADIVGGDLVQGLYKIAKKGTVGATAWALTSFGDAFQDQDSYSSFDAFSDVIDQWGNKTLLPSSTDSKFNITEEEGGFKDFKARSYAKLGVSMVPFTAYLISEVKKGNFKGLKEAVGNTYMKLGAKGKVLAPASQKLKDNIIMMDATFRATVMDNQKEGERLGLNGIEASSFAAIKSSTEAMVQMIMPDSQFLKGLEGKAIKDAFVGSLKKASTKEGLKAASKQYLTNIVKELGEEEINMGVNLITDAAYGIALPKASEFMNSQIELIAGTLMLSGGMGISGSAQTFSNQKKLIYNQIQGNIASVDLQLTTMAQKVKDPEIKKQLSEARQFALDVSKAVESSPENVTADQIDLLIQKKKLIEKKSKTDSAFHPAINSKIEKVDAEIENSGVKRDIAEKFDKDINNVSKSLNSIGQKVDETITLEDNEDSDASDQMRDLLIENGESEEYAEANKNSYGAFVVKDGKEVLIINKSLALRDGVVTTGQHEFLHKLLKASLSSNPEMVAKAGQLLLKEIGETVSTDSELMSRIESYGIDKEITSEVFFEEILPLFSEALTKKDVKLNESSLKKISDFFRQIFQNAGFKKINFKTSEGVVNFIKDYNKAYSKGEFKGSLKSLAGKGKVDIADSVNFSKSDNAKNALEAVKLENLKKARAQGVIGTELPGMVRAQVFNQYSGLGSQKLQDFTDEVVERIYAAKENEKWDGRGSLYGFINGRINLRIKDVVKKEYSRDPLERLYFSGQDGNQFDALENAADVVIEDVKQVAEKPKYKNLLESKLLSSDVLRSISDKVLKTVRTLKSRMDAKVSLNKTITPLVAEIKKDMGKQADIDLKKAMGSKKDGELKSFLLKNKKSILENMTTTWLMGAMPEAIQKQVDGKFTSNWQGKKIDRETVNTNSAGKTSGAEIVRRLPNASQNINDEVFLGYILDAKGNPIRGRKESLAKALAEEVSFDIFNQQLKDPESAISKAFENNQEALGVVIVDNLVEDISRQLDRGTIKFSKNLNDLKKVDYFVEEIKTPKFKQTLVATKDFKQAIKIHFKDEFKAKDLREIAKDVAKNNVVKNFEFQIKKVGIDDAADMVVDFAGEVLLTPTEYKTIMAKYGLKSNYNLRSLSSINQGRLASEWLKENLGEAKFVRGFYRALSGPARLAGFELKTDPDGIIVLDSDIKNPVKSARNGLFNSVNDIAKALGIKSTKGAFRNAEQTRKNWWFSKNFNKLNDTGKKDYLQELYKEGQVDKEILVESMDLLREGYVSGDVSLTGVQMLWVGQFADMTGVGKAAGAPRMIPVIPMPDGSFKVATDAELVKAGLAYPKDPYVLEHMIPAKEIATLSLQYILSGDAKIKKDLLKKLENYDTSILPKKLDDLLKEERGTQEIMGIDFKVGDSPVDTRYDELGITFYDAKNDTYVGAATVFSEEVQSLMKANIEKGKAKEEAAKKSKPTVKLSKNLDKDFNNMLERNKGIASDAGFSRIVAKRRGASKGKFKVWMPSSLNDFKGLTSYTFAGKGRQGDADQKFFKETLLDPYFKGIGEIESSRQRMKDDFVTLNKLHKPTVKSLGKLIESKDYSNDQAIRVYLWNKAGFEIPGLSKRDQKKLLKHIDENPDLKAYADQVLLVSKQPAWIKPGAFWDAQTILSDLGNMTEKVGRKEYIAEFIENVDIIFSEANLNKVEALYGTRHRDALEDLIYRMKNGTNRPAGASKNQNIFNNWVNNSIGAIMFFNRRSALLQTLSTVNFLNWSDNNPAKAAAAFANQPQYWADFSTIFNSAKLKQRRSGLKSDINEAEIASAVKGSKNKATAALSWLLKKGFLPTQMADSFAIAAGGATFYRNRINTLMKKGMSKTEAEAKAFSDFSEISEETQQSGDPALISSDQASVVGRLFLAFQNTPIQLNRSIKKSAQDIYNRRRMPGQTQMQSDFSNISKIVYYGAIQNIIFTSLSNALFALLPGFDDDEPTEKELQELEETKIARMANGIADTTLKGGFGLPGAVLATLKNVIMEYNKQDKKGFKADHAYTIIQAINLAPPIGSKVGKIYSGIQGKTFNRGVIEKRGFSLSLDGKVNLSPKFSVWGKYIEGTTNLPLGRAVDEINAIVEAFDTRNTVMQRIALGLGWRTWDIEVENEENDLINVIEKRKGKGKKNKGFGGKGFGGKGFGKSKGF